MSPAVSIIFHKTLSVINLSPTVLPRSAGTQTDEIEFAVKMTQTEPPLPLQLNGRNTEGHDANGIFHISMLTDFIFATNSHSAQCGCAMDIVVFDNSQGAHIYEVWQCPRCRLCLELHSRVRD